MIHKSFLILFLLASLSFAEDLELKKLFDKRSLTGTIVISSLNNKTVFISDDKRAKLQLSPASTFKIPNTLISLEEQIIKDEYQIIKWDGIVRSYGPWNKDQTLKSAISISCVWCYQIFSKKIGNDKYLKYLEKINYGNKMTGSNILTFWLDGDIKISAVEQIKFLKKLYKNELPFTQKYIDITKKILIVDINGEYIIRAKSGWTGELGWYIGYIETKNKVWFFALNADITRKQLKYREEIVMEALKIKNIL